LIEFSQKEIEFLKKLEVRIATSHDNISHVKPVSFVFEDNAIIIATDYNTRTYANIKSNSQTSIVIDVYKSGDHKAICIKFRNLVCHASMFDSPRLICKLTRRTKPQFQMTQTSIK